MDKKQILGIIIFILLICLVIYVLYMAIKNYQATAQGEPWLVKTTKVARTPKIIPGYMLPFSNDGRYGIEFSYSYWMYVTDWTYKQNEFKHVFHKGNNSADPLIQAPGVFLYPNENRMAIYMNTFNSIKETCDVDDLPIGKWFHVVIVLIEKHLDVYINGRLKKRCDLMGVPKQNYGDLYINLNNGFDGFLSKFRYYNYALPFWKVEQAFNDGPSDQPCEGVGLPAPPYLADDYWTQ